MTTILRPTAGVGHTLPLVLAGNTNHLAFLAINLSLFVLDYAARQKVGGTHLTFGLLHQLPVLPPAAYAQTTPWSPGQSLAAWLLPRLLELTYTAWDLAAFARDHGYDGPPFRWDKDRRFWLRAELDAAYFHLYGLDRADIEHVMNSFWLVHQRDVKAHGSYRTREAIVDLYDRMARAIADRGSYATVLAPPPADSSLAHPLLGREEAEHLAPLLEARRTPSQPASPRKQPTPGHLFADLSASPPMAPDAPPVTRRGAVAKAQAAAASSRETKVSTPAPSLPEALRLVSPISAPLRLIPTVAPPDDLHGRTPLQDDPEVIRHLLADQDPDITPEILAALRALHRAARPLNRAELIDAAAIPAKRWTPTINALLDAGLVEKEGQKRGTTYRPA